MEHEIHIDGIIRGRQASRIVNSIYGAVAGFGLLGVLNLGPIDFARTMYNQAIGDMPVLKSELTDYVRGGIQMKNPTLSAEVIEADVSRKLMYKGRKEGEKVDPSQVSIKKLWDVAEEYPRTDWEYVTGLISLD